MNHSPSSEDEEVRLVVTSAAAPSLSLNAALFAMQPTFYQSIFSNNGTDTTSGGTSTDTVDSSEVSGVTTEPVTIGLTGTDGNDTLSASVDVESQIFTGGAGNDVIYATNGMDTVFGGAGIVDTSDGDDSIQGNAGDDVIYGNSGNDTLYGGNDLVEFGLGNDTLYGGRGSDSVLGNGGDDWISGGGNVVNPEDEADTIYGGQGADEIYGNGGDDFLSGGAEAEEANFDGRDTIYGGLGNDTIDGGGEASDLLYGQLGNDVVSGGGIVSDSGGTDSIYGGDGNDTLYGETEDESSGADVAYDPDADLSTLFDDLKVFPDLIEGGAGIDFIYGGEGADTIVGGGSNDFLYGNIGQDVFQFGSNAGVDVIFDFQPQFDMIQIEAGINGLSISSASDVLALATYIDDGLQIDLSGGDGSHLILLEDYVYTDSDGFIRYMPFTSSNVEII